MTVQSNQVPNNIEAAPEDQLRAQVYRLLARFLAHPPIQSDLDLAASLRGDDTEFGQAVAAFSGKAANADQAELAFEYHELFTGLTRGELIPYASYYLTGFLNEKPLAKLRNAMMTLDIQSDPNSEDPEDHIAAILDMMAGLILGDFGEPSSLPQQKEFFEEHIRSWATHLFRDLESAKSADFYAVLAPVGRHFLDIEDLAFSMVQTKR